MSFQIKKFWETKVSSAVVTSTPLPGLFVFTFTTTNPASTITNPIHFHPKTAMFYSTYWAAEAIGVPLCVQSNDAPFHDALPTLLTFGCHRVLEARLADRLSVSLHESLPDQLVVADAAKQVFLVPVLAQRRDEFLKGKILETVQLARCGAGGRWWILWSVSRKRWCTLVKTCLEIVIGKKSSIQGVNVCNWRRN